MWAAVASAHQRERSKRDGGQQKMRGSLRSALLRRRLVVTNERKGVRRPVVTGAVLVATLSAVGLMLTGTAAGVTGGDVSLDLVASAPLTYSHLTGGGAFD